jgi:hypothetical protein
MKMQVIFNASFADFRSVGALDTTLILRRVGKPPVCVKTIRTSEKSAFTWMPTRPSLNLQFKPRYYENKQSGGLPAVLPGSDVIPGFAVDISARRRASPSVAAGCGIKVSLIGELKAEDSEIWTAVENKIRNLRNKRAVLPRMASKGKGDV